MLSNHGHLEFTSMRDQCMYIIQWCLACLIPCIQLVKKIVYPPCYSLSQELEIYVSIVTFNEPIKLKRSLKQWEHNSNTTLDSTSFSKCSGIRQFPKQGSHELNQNVILCQVNVTHWSDPAPTVFHNWLCLHQLCSFKSCELSAERERIVGQQTHSWTDSFCC